MRLFSIVLALGALLIGEAAAADLVARIDKSEQRMRVYVGGKLAYSWRVSTGRSGFGTPTGSFTVKRMHRMWYSNKYGNAPMPHSIFFRGGYAIHGTNEVRRLGRPASHGCVRLLPSHARTLYGLVKAHGPQRARIVVTP